MCTFKRGWCCSHTLCVWESERALGCGDGNGGTRRKYIKDGSMGERKERERKPFVLKGLCEQEEEGVKERRKGELSKMVPRLSPSPSLTPPLSYLVCVCVCVCVGERPLYSNATQFHRFFNSVFFFPLSSSSCCLQVSIPLPVSNLSLPISHAHRGTYYSLLCVLSMILILL